MIPIWNTVFIKQGKRYTPRISPGGSCQKTTVTVENEGSTVFQGLGRPQYPYDPFMEYLPTFSSFWWYM